MPKKDISSMRRKLIIRIFLVLFIATISLGGLLLFGPEIGSFFGLISINRDQLITPPEAKTPPPVFINVPSSTNKTKINLQGVSVPKTTIELFVNGPKTASVLTDMTGEFLFVDVELIKGKNTIFAKANETKSDTIEIVYDDKSPEIEIISPKHGDTIENLNERVEVEGTVSEPARITVNGRVAIQGPDNSFSYLLGVEEGEVVITVRATDLAGNESEKSIEIEYKRR